MSTMQKIFWGFIAAAAAIVSFAITVAIIAFMLPQKSNNEKSNDAATATATAAAAPAPVKLTPEQQIYNDKRYLQSTTNYILRSNLINKIGTEYNAENNYSQAFKYYLQAAKMGNSYAEANLAGYYLHGYGTLANVIQAYAWEAVAVANGFDTADDQSNAESTRDDMFYNLKNVNFIAQSEGEELADKYYKLYGRNKNIE